MLKIAIAGCGKIADQHAEQIALLSGCQLIAVCDREELMARQLQERFAVPACFTELGEMIERARPDVVHITTPPQTHFALASQCLRAGCHVYVEKPFTLRLEDAGELLRLAEQENRKLTVGHNAQFSHASNRMRRLVAEGYLGGAPVHLESYYCYDLGDAGFAKAMLGDPYHWVRSLPGGLLQNTISHGISRIAEYLPPGDPEVIAHGFTSPLLRSIGETRIVDELRAIIRSGDTTAYFTFSSQMRPSLHQFRVLGPRNALLVDEKQQTLLKLRGTARKSFLEQFLPPWEQARQYAGNSLGNMKRFLQADFHPNHGMKFLIASFYRSIIEQKQPPIPYAEILRTARIMDDIFLQLGSQKAGAGTATRVTSRPVAVV